MVSQSKLERSRDAEDLLIGSIIEALAELREKMFKGAVGNRVAGNPALDATLIMGMCAIRLGAIEDHLAKLVSIHTSRIIQ